LTFYKIAVLNSAGTVAFSDGFSATELRCEAESGTRSMTFQQGATAAIRDLILLGSTASTNILLRSSNSGQPWKLAVSGYRSVRGVNVQDSDARSGVSIPAVCSKDNLNNSNWVFDASWSVWRGANGANFNLAANWSPTGVPNATTRVLVDTANAMVITEAFTVLDLTVGGSPERHR